MAILIAALVIGMLALFWLWKVPISGMVTALKKGGSGTFEAYTIIVLLVGGSAAVIYMVWEVL
ncbi:hypothetical protein [Fodinibius salsisoli]|uniref:Uncharacterized protein n=1 Tax=Fodinibius salsisoli TaxID=2820877 RepID=A0ABT3PTA0_9BACT|nr:hypothetical protein [Fodinibius salsisoli]MCW9709088.1 hypothetical protein [Fodinibius salsisoli]